jgi:hypothetical protein
VVVMMVFTLLAGTPGRRISLVPHIEANLREVISVVGDLLT